MSADPLYEISRQLSAQPKFGDAVLHYTQNVLRIRAGSRIFNKLLSSYVRGEIIACIAFMHYAADPGVPDSGATFQKLLDYVTSRGKCSSRVLRTVLVLSQFGGYLTAERGTQDKRLRIYRPTPRLEAALADWNSRVLGCLDIMFGDSGYARQAAEDPGFLARFYVGIGHPYIEQGIQIAEALPDVYALMQMDSGLPVACVLAEAALLGLPRPPAAEIAARFGASVSQVRNVLRQAGATGFLQPGESGGSDRMVRAIEEYVARELALYCKFAFRVDASGHALPQDAA